MKVRAVPDEDGVRLLQAEGELDVVTAVRVGDELPGLLDGARSVVLDLTGVSFLDSAGVRLVDGLTRRCDRAQVAFALVAPAGGRARRALDLAGMGAPVVRGSREEALQAVR